jgi:hypothetical protein
MKIISLFIGISFLLNNSVLEPKTTELKAVRVIENRTEYNGIYYSYEIKNIGESTIPSKSYKVFFKVNGKTVSFDKSASEVKPGQTIVYHSHKTFYMDKTDNLGYSLEIKFKDSKLEDNIIEGKSIF